MSFVTKGIKEFQIITNTNRTIISSVALIGVSISFSLYFLWKWRTEKTRKLNHIQNNQDEWEKLKKKLLRVLEHWVYNKPSWKSFRSVYLKFRAIQFSFLIKQFTFVLVFVCFCLFLFVFVCFCLFFCFCLFLFVFCFCFLFFCFFVFCFFVFLFFVFVFLFFCFCFVFVLFCFFVLFWEGWKSQK